MFMRREPDWDAMADKSMHREIIGKMPPPGPPPPTMRCSCGMLTLTKPELHRLHNTCANCRTNAEQPGGRDAPTLSRQGNRNMTLAVCLMVVVVFGWLATSVSNGGTRAESTTSRGLD